ncbi:hypothetical protein [Arsenicibacter rosenii]|nr:hypothetical protein [Arsenicibacter rosenii]
MDKKQTTAVGIALGAAALLAGAGYGIYTYIKNKRRQANSAGIESKEGGAGTIGFAGPFAGGFIGNSLVKHTNLYATGENGLIGGGLTRSGVQLAG